MGEAVTWVIDYGSQLVESKFALALMLLGMFVLQAVVLSHTVRRQRREMKAALLECRRDGIEDMGFLSSLMSVSREYRMLLIGVGGGKRAMPAEVAGIDRDFDELRRKVHDARTFRKGRLDDHIRRLQEAQKEDGE